LFHFRHGWAHSDVFSKTETDKIAIVLRSLAVWMRDENNDFRALNCRIFEVVGLQVVDIIIR